MKPVPMIRETITTRSRTEMVDITKQSRVPSPMPR